MASSATHYPHADIHDDESLLDDDMIDADDGEYYRLLHLKIPRVVPDFQHDD